MFSVSSLSVRTVRTVRIARRCSPYVRVNTCRPSELATKNRYGTTDGYSAASMLFRPGEFTGPGGRPVLRYVLYGEGN